MISIFCPISKLSGTRLLGERTNPARLLHQPSSYLERSTPLIVNIVPPLAIFCPQCRCVCSNSSPNTISTQPLPKTFM